MTLTDIILFPIPVLGALASTLLLVPLLKRIAPALRLVDMPSERRIHTQPIPRCGGLAVFLGFHVGCALLYLLPGMTFSARLGADWWWHLFLTSGLIVGVGLVDDIFEIKPLVKLTGQFAVATLAFYFGMRVGNLLGFKLPFMVDYGITVFWFLGAMNAFNLIDGMDGVASGLGTIAALAITGQFILQRYPGDMLVALSLAAACLAFLRFNFNPASIFLGDAGSMFIGFVVAALALSGAAKGTTIASLSIPMVAVGVPAFDTFLAIWRRSMRRIMHQQNAALDDRRGKVFGADLEHLHHRLRRGGLSQRQVALVLYGIAISLSAVALVSRIAHSHAVAIYVLTFLVGTYVVVRHLAYVELWDSTSLLLKGIKRPHRKVVAVLLYPLFDIVLMSAALATTLLITQASLDLSSVHNAWLRYAPWWIAFPFFALVAVKTYKRVWSRARITEFALIGFAYCAGSSVSFATTEFLSIVPADGHLVLFILYTALATPLIVGLRALPRLIQDVGVNVRLAYARHQREDVVRTLIYGAGYSCTLYLRERSFAMAETDEEYHHIVGLIDDDPNLHGRYVHGCKILGGIDNLEEIVLAQDIEEVVVTSFLRDPEYRRLQDIVWRTGVKLVRWRTHLHHHEMSDLHFEFGRVLYEQMPKLLSLPVARIGAETDSMLRQAAEFADAESCFLALAPDSRNDSTLEIRGSWPPHKGLTHCRRVVQRLIYSSLATSFLRGVPLEVRSFSDADIGGDARPFADKDTETRRMIVVPIIYDRQFTGMLVLEKVNATIMRKPETLRMLHVLGNVAALSVLRHYWETERKANVQNNAVSPQSQAQLV